MFYLDNRFASLLHHWSLRHLQNYLIKEIETEINNQTYFLF